MSDDTHIKEVLKKDGEADAESPQLNVSGKEGKVTSEEIMDQMKFIGDKITDVSRNSTINYASSSLDAISPIK